MASSDKPFGFSYEDAAALIRLVDGRGGEVELHPKRISSGGATGFFKSPVGGIPASTGTDPLTPGVVTDALLCEWYDDSGTMKVRSITSPATVPITIYNSEPVLIAAGFIGQYKTIAGRKVADVARC